LALQKLMPGLVTDIKRGRIEHPAQTGGITGGKNADVGDFAKILAGRGSVI